MHILVIEDNEDDVVMVQHMLASVPGMTFDVIDTSRLSTGLAHLATHGADVVLVDLQLPDSEGMDTLMAVQAQAPHLPILVLTGLDAEQVGIEAVQAGAQDYLVKDVITGTLLARAIRYAIERKQSEEGVRQARDAFAAEARGLEQVNRKLQELDRLKSELMATVSHELRAPLHSIIGFTGTLLLGLPGALTDEQRTQLDMIQHAAKHLLDLIDDILNLSNLESGSTTLNVTAFELEGVMADVAARFASQIAQKGLQFIVEPSTAHVELISDRMRVLQVLTNLTANAVKFTERGEIRITWTINQDTVQIGVWDTGIGIAAEDMPHLFTAFRQVESSAHRRYEGTGLGLYLCKKIVALLGGEIWAESIYGQGSRFTFTLPQTGCSTNALN